MLTVFVCFVLHSPYFLFFSVGCLMLYRGNALIYYEGLEKNTACYFRMILKVKVTNISAFLFWSQQDSLLSPSH